MSVEWLGLSHAKLSGHAGGGGGRRGGPLPARREPRPRVIRAEPGGAGSGGAALGIRPNVETSMPQNEEGSLGGLDNNHSAVRPSQQPRQPLVLLLTLPF